MLDRVPSTSMFIHLERRPKTTPSPAVVFARQYAQMRGVRKTDYRRILAQRALHRRKFPGSRSAPYVHAGGYDNVFDLLLYSYHQQTTEMDYDLHQQQGLGGSGDQDYMYAAQDDYDLNSASTADGMDQDDFDTELKDAMYDNDASFRLALDQDDDEEEQERSAFEEMMRTSLSGNAISSKSSNSSMSSNEDTAMDLDERLPTSLLSSDEEDASEDVYRSLTDDMLYYPPTLHVSQSDAMMNDSAQKDPMLSQPVQEPSAAVRYERTTVFQKLDEYASNDNAKDYHRRPSLIRENPRPRHMC